MALMVFYRGGWAELGLPRADGHCEDGHLEIGKFS